MIEIPQGCPIPPSWPPPVDWWDIVVVGMSNGKDSRAMVHQAIDQYPLGKMLMLYNVLGNEHKGSIDEARRFCAELGLPLLYTWKELKGGRFMSRFGEHPPVRPLLDLVSGLARRRGMWSGPANPLCTSTGKRDVTNVALRSDDLTVALAQKRGMWPSAKYPLCTSRGKTQTSDKVLRSGDLPYCLEVPSDLPPTSAKKILFLTGERREESWSRAKRPVWSVRRATSPAKGRLVLWHRPILDWSEQRVWRLLKRAHTPAMTRSYERGFSRHSCLHCIHRSTPEVTLAFTLDPVGSALRVAVEEEIEHKVRLDYFLCPCGSRKTKTRHGKRICANCEQPARDGFQGYRAIWEFVYGPWRGTPSDDWPSPCVAATSALDAWRRDGGLYQVTSWIG